MTKFHYSQIRVKFEGEDGSGPGVNRGFFASLANAIKHCDIVSISLILLTSRVYLVDQTSM